MVIAKWCQLHPLGWAWLGALGVFSVRKFTAEPQREEMDLGRDSIGKRYKISRR